MPILDGMMFLQDPLPLASEAANLFGDATVATGGEIDSFSIRTRLARIMQGGDFPALSRQVIDAITTINDDAASLQRLASIVLREYGLALSVVRTANSAHYRRGGRPTESATHAMMMLGARVVRQLAGSMLLFEHFQRRSPELKELMILSLLTANHARATALQLGYDDPEAAHLSGMFRNLGEVLVACYFHDDYPRIRSLIQDDGRSDLFVEMAGADAKRYGRDRLLKDLSPSNFALLPLVLEMKLIGCLYFDSTIESVHSTATSRQLLCDLRDHLVAAFAHHRASLAEPAEGAA